MSEPLVLESGGTSVDLHVASDPAVQGVRVRRDAAANLASVHVVTFSAEVRKKSERKEELTRDIPNVAHEALQHLDAQGIISEGVVVKPGDVLVGVIEEKLGTMLSPEEKLLRSIFGEKAGDVRDVSLRCPPDMKGEVTRVERSETKTHHVVRVEVTDRRPLRIGDLLELGGTRNVVSAIVDELSHELSWSGGAGTLRVAKIGDAESMVEARSIGPYSLVTQQPLGGKAQFGGQRMTAPQLRALEAGGAWHAAHEMLTIKSDDVAGRTRLYESIVKGETRFVVGVPETRSVLFRELEALGFELEEVTETKEATKAPSGDAGGLKDIFNLFDKPKEHRLDDLRIRLSTSDAIRQRSHGEVRKPETINYRTYDPEPGGLFCARIFGPVKDYECVCGKYKRMKHRGVVCEECGVEVIQSKVRRERFGHIELPAPLLHPWGYETVAGLLGLSVDDIDRIIREQLTVDMQDPTDWREGGAAALRDAVGEQGEHLFFTAWPVLPPDLRPLVPMSGGRFATSDLNDLYRHLINRCNRMKRLIELNAPVIILRNEYREMMEALDELLQNGRRAKPRTGPNKRPLRSILDMVEGHLGRGRQEWSMSGKRVDYSGAAVVVPHDLPVDVVMLPRDLALEVFKPWIYNRLEALGYVTTIKSAKRMVEKRAKPVLEALETGVRKHPVIIGPKQGERFAGFDVRLWDELAVGMAPARMQALGLSAAGDSVVVHVPASAVAIRETRALGVTSAKPDGPAEGWFGQAVVAEDLPTAIFEAALRESTDRLKDRRARRLLGLLGDPSASTLEDDQRSWEDPPPPKDPSELPPINPWLLRRVDELELSVRVANCLQNMNVEYLGDLVQRTEVEFLKTKNFGRAQLKELKEILNELGLALGMKVEGWQEYRPGSGTTSGPSTLDPRLLESLDWLPMSMRTANKLENAGITLVGDLVHRTEAELLKTKSFGRADLREVKALLQEEGLHLGMNVPGWWEMRLQTRPPRSSPSSRSTPTASSPSPNDGPVGGVVDEEFD